MGHRFTHQPNQLLGAQKGWRMLNQRQHGVTLLELMIGLVMLAILLGMGVPSFIEWIRNTQNRTAAESVLNGLQLARTEAVRRNTPVRFTLTDATGRVAWTVGCVTPTTNCPADIQTRPAAEGSVQARVGVATAPIPSPIPAKSLDAPLAAGSGLVAGVTFNGIGRVPNANVGTDFTRADITSTASSAAKRYVVVVGVGGQIRMCDPTQSFPTSPQGC
jgi:type IV fimbrial biogenesis protein FimT